MWQKACRDKTAEYEQLRFCMGNITALPSSVGMEHFYCKLTLIRAILLDVSGKLQNSTLYTKRTHVLVTTGILMVR